MMGIHFKFSIGVLAFAIVIGVFSFAFAYKVVRLVRSLSFILAHLASGLFDFA